jgi:hypothetical protein
MIERRMIACGMLTTALLFLNAISTAAGASCATWMASLKDYDDAFERVMRGEPEDLLRLVREAREPGRKAGALETVEGKLAGLRGIAPPAELAPLHGKLIAFAEAVAEAVQDAPAIGAGAKAAAPRPCYETLLDYYLELRDLMVEHNCRGGDLEALTQRIIPQLEALLHEGPENEVAGE